MSTATTPNIDAPTMQQRGPRTTSTRKTAVLVGLLFLTATAAFIFAEAINSRVLSQPNFLADASSQTTILATSALLLFAQFGVVGIAVLLFPLLKSHGESLALAHVGFRVTELAASLFYLAVPLLAIELGAGLRDGTVDGSASSSLGALLQAQHNVAILMIYIATGAAGICMATLLYRSRLIPRWLAILGLVTYPTLLAGCILDMFNLVDVTQGIGLVALGPGRLVRVHPSDLAHRQGIQRPRPRLTTQVRAGDPLMPFAGPRHTPKEHDDGASPRQADGRPDSTGHGSHRPASDGRPPWAWPRWAPTSQSPAGTAGARKTRPARSARPEAGC